MKIQVNGEEMEIAPGMTIKVFLEDYLKAKGIDITLVTVEVNFCIPPRNRWGNIRLAEGDNLEIIRFVGGG